MTALEKIIDNFTQEIKSSGSIDIEDIPNIDLYMDQVTTFMDKALVRNKRYDEDKILTKTMINNYTKAKIFPAPVKKKYSRMHIMLLIMIYHLKTVLSIRDIGILFQPVLSVKSLEEQEKMIHNIYTGFTKLQLSTQQNMQSSAEGIQDTAIPVKEIIEAYQDEKIEKILLVLLLAIRANAEKQLAEKVLDTYF
ncbi:DUF1836 domain-containing protein [Anaerotignum propionicum]|jgi:hypothetical protein|uniref:DUF1836 domain-containing protein n=1 Tax=Anaerotignum propionicum DSM 1682 TaxID=991789 RepID=A0A0X1U898_ANAPI|nr:DUF1836 domain-containing protein [Anaerotignum propionicum]AMJ41151.1 hypothetical protein CPRO_15580 [Anaerotignum propionicum DSM 1682]MEA5057645.1 DUF1836 domain-containing protein [Anaerotignum propionicum]SHE64726.1 protein of unknown function [[Clostridium] propionicum DSM 1682] [Anaerotignum propionicum DSM 1682]